MTEKSDLQSDVSRVNSAQLQQRFGGKRRKRSYYENVYIENKSSRAVQFSKLKQSLISSQKYLCGRTGANVLLSVVSENGRKSTTVYGRAFAHNWNHDLQKRHDELLKLLSAAPTDTDPPRIREEPKVKLTKSQYENMKRDKLKFHYRQAWKRRCKGRPGFSNKSKRPDGFPVRLWLPISDMTKPQLIEALMWLDEHPPSGGHVPSSSFSNQDSKGILQNPAMIEATPTRLAPVAAPPVIDADTVSAFLESPDTPDSTRANWQHFKTLSVEFKGVPTEFVVDRDISADGDCFFHSISKYLSHSKDDLRRHVSAFEATHCGEKWLQQLWEQFCDTGLRESLAKHITMMAKSNTYASEVEVLLTCLLFNLDIWTWNAMSKSFMRSRELMSLSTVPPRQLPTFNTPPKPVFLAHININNPLSTALLPDHYIPLLQKGHAQQVQQAQARAQQDAKQRRLGTIPPGIPGLPSSTSSGSQSVQQAAAAAAAAAQAAAQAQASLSRGLHHNQPRHMGGITQGPNIMGLLQMPPMLSPLPLQQTNSQQGTLLRPQQQQQMTLQQPHLLPLVPPSNLSSQ